MVKIKSLKRVDHRPESPEKADAADYTKQLVRELLEQARVIKIKPKRKILWSSMDLMNFDFTPVNWVVPGLIPEGLTILAGASKLGKSWFCLDLVHIRSNGGLFFNDVRFSVPQGKALYCALEDVPRRIRSRMEKRGFRGNRNLQFLFSLPRGKAGIDYLKEFIEEDPVDLIILDTYGKWSEIDDLNKYKQVTEEVSLLKDFGDENEISIILVHHVKKGSESDILHSVSGSNALVGVADTTIILNRKRGSQDVTMFLTGRDVEEAEYALDFNKSDMGWSFLGERHEVQTSEPRQMIYDILKDGGKPLPPKVIREKLNKLDPDNSRAASTVKTLLGKMIEDGTLINMSGTYRVNEVDRTCLQGMPPPSQ